MVHGAHLAVNDLVAADDLAAESLANRLVAEADAEKGDAGAGSGLGQGQADPGGGGVAGAGGKDDHLGCHRDHVLHLQGIVAFDDDIGPKLAQVVDEVPGEAVVVVDQEKHGGRPFPVQHNLAGKARLHRGKNRRGIHRP
jgi:hypothetical protein